MDFVKAGHHTLPPPPQPDVMSSHQHLGRTIATPLCKRYVNSFRSMKFNKSNPAITAYAKDLTCRQLLTASPHTPCQNPFGLLSLHSESFSSVPSPQQKGCASVCDHFSCTDERDVEMARCHFSFLEISFPCFEQVKFKYFNPPPPKTFTLSSQSSTEHSTSHRSFQAVIQTGPHSIPYVVLKLGPPGLLTDFCKELVRWKGWSDPCPGIWPCGLG